MGGARARSSERPKSSQTGGGGVFRKKLRRDALLACFASQPQCLVAMEACASAHYWPREIAALGHGTRLIPPAYFKPFVRRQKHDMADAEAICEAAQRPSMRFVTPKSAEAQGAAVVFRTGDLLVRQRTQLINPLRGHLLELGFIVRQVLGTSASSSTWSSIPSSELPAEARPVLAVIAESLQSTQTRIAVLYGEIAARAKADPVATQLMTIPGVGPVVATRWWRRRLMRAPSGAGATSPPGWGSRPGSTPAARSGWAGRPRWASAPGDGCRSSAPGRRPGTPDEMDRGPARSWSAC